MAHESPAPDLLDEGQLLRFVLVNIGHSTLKTVSVYLVSDLEIVQRYPYF